jgi:RecA-family ATPase
MNQNCLRTIDGETLMSRPLMPIPFVIQSLLPVGLHILAGAPKIGKSWLALWLCLQVAKGEAVWSFATEKKKALYLCLEDSENRIQNRLFDITEDAPSNIHFAVCAGQIGDGLESQIENFVAEHPETGLIVIDTLQKVRRISYDNAYANDYRDISVLKSLADRLGVAILLVHHLRKQHDDDPMNMVSGTTGITGAVDGNFVLAKHKRSSSKAVLVCSGRDIEYRELELEFDSATHVWQLISDSVKNPADFLDDTVSLVCGYVKEVGAFLGTSSELVELLEKSAGRKIPPGTLSKKLLRNHDELQSLGITCAFRRSNGRRIIGLRCNSASSDGKNEMSPYPENAVPADPAP